MLIPFYHAYCTLYKGTDCQDCGPVGADNFTRSDDDGWWDDDDDYWNFNDGNFLGKVKGVFETEKCSIFVMVAPKNNSFVSKYVDFCVWNPN